MDSFIKVEICLYEAFAIPSARARSGLALSFSTISNSSEQVNKALRARLHMQCPAFHHFTVASSNIIY